MKPLKISKTDLLKHLGLGILFAALLYLILYLSIGLNYMAMAVSIYRVPWVPFYFAFACFMFYVFGLIFQAIMQPKFENNNLKTIFKSAGIYWGILIFYMCFFILGSSLLLMNFFFAISLMLAAPMLLLCSFVSSMLYAKTNNILAGAITNTVFLVLIVATTSPFMSIF